MMMKAPVPTNEHERQWALRDLGVLDAPTPPVLEDLVRLAAQVCEVPVATLGFMDADHQEIKASVGFEGVRVPRDEAFCAHAILQPDLMVVPDVQADERFAHSPLATRWPQARFYAAMPLATSEGYVVGTLSVVDVRVRTLGPHQAEALRTLGRVAMAWLEAQSGKAVAHGQGSVLKGYEGLLDAVEGVAWEADTRDLRFTYVGRRVSEVLGYTPEEWLSQPAFWQEHIHPDDRDRVLGVCRRVIASGTPQEVEYRLLAADGHQVWVRDVMSLATPPGGHPTLCGLMQDVTRGRRASRPQRSGKDVFDSLAEGMQEHAVIMLDTAGVVVAWNAGAERVTGYGGTEIIGQPVTRLYPRHGAGAAGLARSLERAAETGRASDSGTLVRRDGSRFPAELVVSALRDGQGLLHGFALVVRDLSERMRVEEQLRQMQKMVAIGRLAGSIAHDFNNVLTVINGFSELMLHHLGADAPLRHHVEEINRAATHAASLPRQLLAFSRKQSSSPQPLDLNAVLQDMRGMLERLLSSEIELSLEMAPCLGTVKADQGQVEQVIMNLVVNARDAMPKGGRLTIATRNAAAGAGCRRGRGARAGGYVVLAVRDTGTGMSKEVQARLFEPFFTTKANGMGTGLGLPIVKSIVSQSGGYIEVHSEVDKGSTFEVYLPRIDREACPAPPER